MHAYGEKGFPLYPRKAREKSRVLESWIFWLSVIMNFTATMKMATIISTIVNGNTSTDHEESLNMPQSTCASTICGFEMFDDGLFTEFDGSDRHVRSRWESTVT
jgi:hypothetical protein